VSSSQIIEEPLGFPLSLAVQEKLSNTIKDRNFDPNDIAIGVYSPKSLTYLLFG
jgi:hypothetical protein